LEKKSWVLSKKGLKNLFKHGYKNYLLLPHPATVNLVSISCIGLGKQIGLMFASNFMGFSTSIIAQSCPFTQWPVAKSKSSKTALI
jgi:hypothetical protein